MMAFIGGCFIGGIVMFAVMCCITISSSRLWERVQIGNTWHDVDEHGRVIFRAEADYAGR
jgi:hypothetical protein